MANPMGRNGARGFPALLAAFAVFGALWAGACGGAPTPPARGVIEESVKDWKFRRYQALLDVEVWVADNPAEAHTASYVQAEAEKRGRLGARDVVNAFVTRYQRDEGVLRALVALSRRLAQEQGYRVTERKLGGARVFEIRGAGEIWAIWAADRHVVKIGGRGRGGVPEPVVEAYADRYPSRLRSGMLEGPLPEAPERAPDPEDDPPDPDRPRPDWQD